MASEKQIMLALNALLWQIDCMIGSRTKLPAVPRQFRLWLHEERMAGFSECRQAAFKE